MLEKTTVIQYMFNSTHDDFTKFFKDHSKLKKAIFFMVFDNGKTCSVEYIDAYAFIPKDEYSFYQKGNSPIILQNVFVVETDNFQDLKLGIKNFNAQIDNKKDIRDMKINVNSKIVAEPEIKKAEPVIEEKIETKPNIIEDDYDSDSSNTIEEDEVDNPEEFAIKSKIDESAVNKIIQIIENEEANKSQLSSCSIQYAKFENLTYLENFISNISSQMYLSLQKQIFSKAPSKKYNSKFLRSFIFTDNYVKEDDFEDGWNLICKFLKSKRTPKAKQLADETDLQLRKFNVLRTLDLSMNSITNVTLLNIIKSLKQVRLHKLNIQSNLITKEGALYLANWLKKNKTLQELYFHQNDANEFLNEGLETVLNALISHRKIHTINCGMMILTGSGKCLSKLINMNKLKVLKIRDCRFSEEDLEQIINSVIDSSVEELDLSENNGHFE